MFEEAMKDVLDCEKLRWVVKKLWFVNIRMGQPNLHKQIILLWNFVFDWDSCKFKLYQVFSGIHVRFRFYQVFIGIHVNLSYQVFSGIHVNPTKHLIEPKLYMNRTKNLRELKLYMNPTKNLIEHNLYMNPTKNLRT